MPVSFHQRLSQTATKFKRKKAVVMRMALEQALKDLDDDAGLSSVVELQHPRQVFFPKVRIFSFVTCDSATRMGTLSEVDVVSWGCC
jgi:hypothetical protein